jgi:hypothetical protein
MQENDNLSHVKSNRADINAILMDMLLLYNSNWRYLTPTTKNRSWILLPGLDTAIETRDKECYS